MCKHFILCFAIIAMLSSCTKELQDPEDNLNLMADEEPAIDFELVTPNQVFFSTVNFPELVTCQEYLEQDQTAFYTYCWDFGDCSEPVFDETPEHIYASTGTYTVRLSTSHIYEDPDHGCTMGDEVHVITTTVTISSVESTPPSHTPHSENGSTWVNVEERMVDNGTVPANPTGGEMIYYLVTCKNTGGYDAGSWVRCSFSDDYFFASEDWIPASCDNDFSVSLVNGLYVVEFAIGATAQEVFEYYIPVLGKPGIGSPDQTTVSAKVHAVLDDDYDEDTDSQVSNVGSNWDPNVKTADCESFAAGDRVTFTVQYENHGDEIASTVWMVDELPEGLDLNTLQFESLYSPGSATCEGTPTILEATIPSKDKFDYRTCGLDRSFCQNNIVMAVDKIHRRMVCILKQANVKPAGDKIGPELCQGYFKYSVKTEEKLRADQISASACIYFDNVNNETVTNEVTLVRDLGQNEGGYR